MRGNVYINPSWAKSLEGIPLNTQKMASIDLTDLANPDEEGTYFVNGEATLMTHREALHLLVEKAGSTFEFPGDFEESLIALAQITPEFFDHLYMEPLPLIKQHYTELQFIAKKMHALSEDPSQTELYRKLQPMHYEILGHLVNPNAVALEQAIERMMHELTTAEI